MKQENQPGIPKTLTKDLDQNIKMFQGIFTADPTIKFRNFENHRNPKQRFCLIYVDGLASSTMVNQHIIEPILITRTLKKPGILTPAQDEDILDELSKKVLYTNEITRTGDVNKMLSDILSGNTVLMADGAEDVLMLGTRGWTVRGISEPEAEKVLTGPREGFTEAIIINLSMVRRKLKNPNLKFEFKTLGKQTKTTVCLCYIEGIANKKTLKEMERRLSHIDIDSILDTNYITELIRDSSWSPFQTTGSTERPDVVAAKLLEGRVALVVDGSPAVMTAPFFFLEYFQTNDDYYSGFYFGSFGRMLRILGFLVTTSLPAIYLALIIYHQELLPTRFLLNLSEARQGLPFPTFLEMLILILAFELIREGGSRIPSGFGQTLSIVGGLVLGQASVEAKLVSIPVVIIIAFTGITGLTIPQLKTPVLMLRILWLVLASFLGFFGYLFGVIGLLIHLTGLKSFGIPYTSSLSRNPKQKFKDTIIRAPWNKMIFRPAYVAAHNVTRQRHSAFDDDNHPTGREVMEEDGASGNNEEEEV